MDKELKEDIFSLEEESGKVKFNEKFLKDTYDYDIRFFIHDKSLVIQAPTWKMRNGQTIETYFDEFRRNPANATRDFGANPIDAVQPAIHNKDYIDLAFERLKNYTHPISSPPRVKPDGDLTETVFDPEFWTKDGISRYCHVDIGLTRDRLGLAIGHAYKWEDTEINDIHGRKKIVKEPNIKFDLLASFKGYRDNPIQLITIRKIIFDVIKQGFPIVSVTLDGYQSADFIQAMNQINIKSKVLSIDKTPEPFDEMIRALYGKRIHLYPLYVNTPDGKVNLPEKEMRQLERFEDRYDHPLGGSHDLLQAISGVVYTIKMEAKPTGGGYIGYLEIDREDTKL
jgi:hypothetical protein